MKKDTEVTKASSRLGFLESQESTSVLSKSSIKGSSKTANGHQESM